MVILNSSVLNPWKIVALLNTYKKLSIICDHVNCENEQKLSRIIRRYFRKRIISEHLVLPLEIIQLPCSVAIINKFQKTKTSCLKKPPRVISKYISFTGVPVEINYLIEDCNFIEENLDTSICELELCEPIVKTLIPLEKIDSYEVELIDTNYSLEKKFDSIDINMILELFRLSSPPVDGELDSNEIIEYLNKKLGVKNSKYHYYSHVYKYVIKHYSVRNNADYLLILISSPGRKELEHTINNLLKAELITGIWQIHSFSKIPVIALIHAWGYFERFLDDRYEHGIVRNTYYTLYPVLGVKHGYE